MASSLTGNNNFPKSFGDSRNDLGYGRLSAKFHKERTMGGSTFPYVDKPDNMQDIDIENNLIDLVMSKLGIPQNFDPLPTLDSEGQYFVSGNTKIIETQNALSPIPDLYKKRTSSAGGTSPSYPHGPASGFSTRSRPTGSKYGYSNMGNEKEDSDEPAYTLEDIFKKQLEEIRKYVRGIILMELG